MELMLVVLIVSVLAAIAIPKFLAFQARARRSEVKSSLRTAYVTQRAYWQQYDRYAAGTVTAGFSVERGNRYHYVFVDDCAVSEARTTVNSAVLAGQTCIQVDTFAHAGHAPSPATAVTEFVTPTSFLLGASADLGNGSALDQWSISSESRASGATSSATTCAGMAVAAGEPCNDASGL